jgi:hypothetical protein
MNSEKGRRVTEKLVLYNNYEIVQFTPREPTLKSINKFINDCNVNKSSDSSFLNCLKRLFYHIEDGLKNDNDVRFYVIIIICFLERFYAKDPFNPPIEIKEIGMNNLTTIKKKDELKQKLNLIIHSTPTEDFKTDKSIQILLGILSSVIGEKIELKPIDKYPNGLSSDSFLETNSAPPSSSEPRP